MNENTGEHIIACAGELHLEICLKDLRDFMGGNVEIKVSQPVVPLRETISSSTSHDCLSKSANKLNRLIANGESIDEKLSICIDNGTLFTIADKERPRYLSEKLWLGY